MKKCTSLCTVLSTASAELLFERSRSKCCKLTLGMQVGGLDLFETLEQMRKIPVPWSEDILLLCPRKYFSGMIVVVTNSH